MDFIQSIFVVFVQNFYFQNYLISKYYLLMKKSKLLLISGMVFFLSLFSCNDEETNLQDQGNEALANEQNAAEEKVIPTSTLQTGIEINGATIETGNPPASTVSMDFQVNKDKQDAYQRTGLVIQFSSNDPVAGAYIQFKDVDGNPTSNYFKVPYTSFNGRLLKKEISYKNKNHQARTTEEFSNEININFGSDMPEGRFCYDIRLYDGENNVGQNETVCVTVEAWGGNAEIVGKWIFDRSEPAENGDNTTGLICQNGDSLDDIQNSIEYIYQHTFVLNSDGTYYKQYDEEGKYLDREASKTNCSAVYGDLEKESYKYSGNWAFNEDKETLIVIDFKYEDLIDLTNNEDYVDGDIYLDNVKAEILNNELVITDSDYVMYFKRR